MQQLLPSIPLITCDPYFSLWSPANRLTDAPTCHWTGAVKKMEGEVTVDGNRYRFMGQDDSLAAMEQTAVEITPTATSYVF
ncbi:MAG: DUF4964 domain-containing protein, partial [Angelakisella sp.]